MKLYLLGLLILAAVAALPTFDVVPQYFCYIVWTAIGFSTVAKLVSGEFRCFRKFLLSPSTILIALYFLAGLFSIANISSKGFYWGAVHMRATIVAGFYFAFACLPQKPRDLFLAIGVFAFCAFAVAMTNLVEEIGLSFKQITWYGHNILGDTCSSLVVIILVLFLSLRSFKWKLLLGAGGLLSLIGLLATTSRGSVLGAAIASLVVMLSRRLKVRTLLIGLALFCIMMAAFLTVLPEEILAERSDLNANSAKARPLAWNVLVDYLANNPFQSTGWGQFPEIYRKCENNYCNIFLQDWVEAGPAGLIISVGIFVAALYQAWRNSCLLPSKSAWYALNLIGAGIVISRYFRANLDEWWMIYTISHEGMAYGAMGIITFCRVRTLSPTENSQSVS